MYLDHEFAYHPVKDSVVVVPVFRMSHKVLDRFRRRLGKQPDMNIAKGGVQNRSGTGQSRFGLHLLPRVEVFGFLVLHVARRLDNIFVVGEHVEPDFAGSSADEHRIWFFGLLE